MALCEVENSELRWVLVEAGVGCEDRATTLSARVLAVVRWLHDRLLVRTGRYCHVETDLWLRMTLPILN